MADAPHHGRAVLLEVVVAAALETAGRRIAQRHQVKRHARQADHDRGPLRWLLRALVSELTASGSAELAWQRQRVLVALDKAAAAQSVAAASARHTAFGRLP